MDEKTTVQSTQIRKCPFCGWPGKSIAVMTWWFGKPKGYYIKCSNEECGCELNIYDDTVLEAVQTWNTRAL